MTYQVILHPGALAFDVQEGETVLEGALNNQLPFPHRCQVGACAACLCRIIKGTVKYQLEPMLTEKEQQEGWIFACQALATSHLELTLEE